MSNFRQSILDFVRNTNLPFEVMEIDPAFADTAVFCQRYQIPLENSANTLVLASKKEPKQFAVCVALATTRLDVNRKARDIMNAGKLSFASAEEMKSLTGMEVGAVTPFGLKPEVPIYVDARIKNLEWIVLGGGERNWKLKISPEIFSYLKAVYVDGLANPLSAD